MTFTLPQVNRVASLRVSSQGSRCGVGRPQFMEVHWFTGYKKNGETRFRVIIDQPSDNIKALDPIMMHIQHHLCSPKLLMDFLTMLTSCKVLIKNLFKKEYLTKLIQF